MVLGAHRGLPVAAAPCTPGLRPAKSPLRGTFDLSLQASGRAEAASVQNTALSPHPCGLPRPAGNVSAILRPPAPAVSAAPDPVVIWGCRPGQAQSPPGNMLGTEPDVLPGGGGDCYRFTTFSAREKRYHVWLQRSLRSRLVFCVMSLMVLGAHRGRPVAAAPCTPGLRPAKSPLRGTFDLSLQASGRAEAASLQNTALSPHPCGLPRPSGNVSAILRPPAPAVSAALDPVVIWGCRPGQAQPPPGRNSRKGVKRECGWVSRRGLRLVYSGGGSKQRLRSRHSSQLGDRQTISPCDCRQRWR